MTITSIIENAMFALDFGFQTFEKVWEYVGDKWQYVKLKPLAPDRIRVIVDKELGNFAGVRQAGVLLGPEKCFHYIHDGEPGRYYGRSRHENIREDAYFPWIDTAKKKRQYATKVAGVIPMVNYPIGESRDAKGNKKSNFEIAQAILTALGSGKGVCMPREIMPWAQDVARSGLDPEMWAAWKIQFLETKGNHAMGFVKMLQHYETLMLRGWLIPERTVAEGQHGTKAEAGTHGDWALLIADLTFQELLRQINWHVINPLTLYNFGVENTVTVTRAGLDPAVITFMRAMVVLKTTDKENMSG